MDELRITAAINAHAQTRTIVADALSNFIGTQAQELALANRRIQTLAEQVEKQAKELEAFKK